MSSQRASLVFCLESVVHGHHIYKHARTPLVEAESPIDIEEDNVTLCLHVLSCRVPEYSLLPGPL